MKILVLLLWIICGSIVWVSYWVKQGINFLSYPFAKCVLWCSDYLGLEDEPAQNTTNRK